MGNLATSYGNTGRHEDALELNEKVLELQKEMLGEDDPYTLMTMGNIASSYRKLGRREDSMEQNQVALEMQTRVLGIEHSCTLHTSRNLLLDYKHFGKSDRLLELLQVTLPAHERCLGADHPYTIRLRDQFGNLLADSEESDLPPAALSALSSRIITTDTRRRGKRRLINGARVLFVFLTCAHILNRQVPQGAVGYIHLNCLSSSREPLQ
jgi:hypothetical protein